MGFGSVNPVLISVDHNKKGNDQQIQNAWELNAGAPAHGIYLRRKASIGGIIGDDVCSFPTMNDWMFIPHLPVIKSPFGRASRAGIPTADDTFFVQAFTVGDPRT